MPFYAITCIPKETTVTVEGTDEDDAMSTALELFELDGFTENATYYSHEVDEPETKAGA